MGGGRAHRRTVIPIEHIMVFFFGRHHMAKREKIGSYESRIIGDVARDEAG